MASTEIIEKQDTRIPQLDGLRGVAVLMVVLFHYINNGYPLAEQDNLGTFENILVKVTYFGWTGVDLFFVLSGFLIGSILFKNIGSPNFFRTFYIRRAARIIPVYFMLLIVFWVVKQTSWYQSDAYIFQKNLPLLPYFLFLQNFVMSFAGHFGPEALTPTWSLAVEEQFYLLIPLLIFYTPPRFLKYIIVACLLGAPVARLFAHNWYEKYTALYCRIDSPMAGILLAYLFHFPHIKKYLVNNPKKIATLLAGVVLLSGLLYRRSDPGIFNHTLLAMIFFMIIILAVTPSFRMFQTVLTNRLLVFMGSISYFFYLFHQLINGLFHLLILNQKIPVIIGAPSVLVSMAAFVVTLILAVLSKRFIEQPLINASHQFLY